MLRAIHKALFVLFPLVFVLLGGGLYVWEAAVIAGLFAVLLCGRALQVSRRQLIALGLAALGFVLSELLGAGHGAQVALVFFLCLFLPLLLSEAGDKEDLLIGLFLASTLATILGLLAYGKLLPVAEWAGVVDGSYRLQSVFGYANVAAVFCGLGVLLGLYFGLKEKSRRRVLYLVGLGINALSLVLTFSRLGLFCVALGLLVALMLQYKAVRRVVYCALPLLLIAVVVLFLTGKAESFLGTSLVSRIIYWTDGAGVALKHPFGIGVNGWEDMQYAVQTARYAVRYVHNGYLQILLDGGVLALGGFLLLVFGNVRNLARRWKETRSPLYAYLLGALTLTLTHGFVDIDFSFSALMLTLGLLLSFGNRGGIQVPKYLPAVVLALGLYAGIGEQNRTPRPNSVEGLSAQCTVAYRDKDYETLYALTKELLDRAPRQQMVYDLHTACLRALDRLDEVPAVFARVDAINSTMHPLCKYLPPGETTIEKKIEQFDK